MGSVARWSKQPNESGLSRIGQGERGFLLKKDGEVIIHVSLAGQRGWYWYGMDINTLTVKPTFATPEEAKADAWEYYKAAITSPPPQEPKL